MNKSNTWDFIASEYDTITQLVTVPCVAKSLEQVSLLPVTSSAHSIKVIDLAAGPGILATLLDEAYLQAGYLEKVTFLSTDCSSRMVELAERRFASRNWPSSQFSARTLDAMHLVDVPSDHYTHAFSTFGLMMIPDASKALGEMFRVLEPSGTIGITTWHKVGWLPFFSECVARAKGSSNKEENANPPLPIVVNCSAESYVRTVLENAGFQNIMVSTFETPWSFAN
jgi:ubiquinone/menaquinone biosynthesis C-methylase UbiE